MTIKNDKIVLIAASETPKILKVTSLQLVGIVLLRESNNFDLLKYLMIHLHRLKAHQIYYSLFQNDTQIL